MVAIKVRRHAMVGEACCGRGGLLWEGRRAVVGEACCGREGMR